MKSIILKSVLVLVGLYVVVSFGLYVVATSEQISQLSSVTARLPEMLILFRWALIVLAYCYWPELVAYLAKVKNLEPEQINQANGLRNRIPLYMALFEVVLNLPMYLQGI